MRFLQVSQARSGTHMLRAAFMAYPGMAWWDYRGAIADQPGVLPDMLTEAFKTMQQPSGTMTHFGEFGRDFILQHEAWIRHWSRLRAMHDHAIILTRWNDVRRYLSKQIAERDLVQGGEGWNSFTPRTREVAPIRIELRPYLAYKLAVFAQQEAIMACLHPYHHILYENLCENWSGTMRRVYDYLDLKWDDPKLTTHRQETRPMREIVENYDELVAEAEAVLPNTEVEMFLRDLKDEQ